MNSMLPDTLLPLIRQAGYCVETAFVYYKGQRRAYADDSKEAERWIVIADNQQVAVKRLAG